jgi:hypothetical protein
VALVKPHVCRVHAHARYLLYVSIPATTAPLSRARLKRPLPEPKEKEGETPRREVATYTAHFMYCPVTYVHTETLLTRPYHDNSSGLCLFFSKRESPALTVTSGTSRLLQIRPLTSLGQDVQCCMVSGEQLQQDKMIVRGTENHLHPAFPFMCTREKHVCLWKLV